MDASEEGGMNSGLYPQRSPETVSHHWAVLSRSTTLPWRSRSTGRAMMSHPAAAQGPDVAQMVMPVGLHS